MPALLYAKPPSRRILHSSFFDFDNSDNFSFDDNEEEYS